MSAEIQTIWCLFICISSTCAVTIKTTHGRVQGSDSLLFNGKTITAFLGIPYAAPPIGHNRYAPPQPLQPWNKTLEANTKPNGCIQGASYNDKSTKWYISDLPESEDCLYLNIWTPNVSPDEKLPVMIWIFPGGFFAGSSSMSIYNGGVLASEQNVIVVSLNYRLAQFGFLFLNTSDVPGNAGLQDQIQAIRWINDNIGNFGGDKNKITLFGESAGSMSCGFHLTNMNIQDLFQNVIMESGPVAMTKITVSQEQAFANALALIENVNCKSDDVSETLNCLRSKSTDELMFNYARIPDYYMLIFLPVRNGNEVPFPPETIALEIPEDNRKNVLGGSIPNEMGYFLQYFFPKSEFNNDMTISENDLKAFMGFAFQVTDPTLQDLVIHEYKNFTGDYNPNQIRVQAAETVTDVTLTCLLKGFMQSWATASNKVFYYIFNHRPSIHPKDGIPEWTGPVHGDEIPFVFGAPLDPQNGFTEKEKELSERIMTLWANFAKSGSFAAT